MKSKEIYYNSERSNGFSYFATIGKSTLIMYLHEKKKGLSGATTRNYNKELNKYNRKDKINTIFNA